MKYILYALALIPITWILYLAIMTLQRARDEGKLTKPVKAIATGLLYIGMFVDFLLNVIIGTTLFLELPKEWMLSPRVARLKRGKAGYRQTVAAWICDNLLDPFDPSGCHCK